MTKAGKLAGAKFERAIKNMLDRYYMNQSTPGVSIRFPQHKYSYQVCDVLGIPQNRLPIMAFECKSALMTTRILTWNDYFTTDKYNVHQIERFSQFCAQSGCEGYLAIEIRGKGSRKNQAWIMPVEVAFDAWLNKSRSRRKSGLDLNALETYANTKMLKREKGGYVWC